MACTLWADGLLTSSNSFYWREKLSLLMSLLIIVNLDNSSRAVFVYTFKPARRDLFTQQRSVS